MLVERVALRREHPASNDATSARRWPTIRRRRRRRGHRGAATGGGARDRHRQRRSRADGEQRPAAGRPCQLRPGHRPAGLEGHPRARTPWPSSGRRIWKTGRQAGGSSRPGLHGAFLAVRPGVQEGRAAGAAGSTWRWRCYARLAHRAFPAMASAPSRYIERKRKELPAPVAQGLITRVAPAGPAGGPPTCTAPCSRTKCSPAPSSAAGLDPGPADTGIVPST